jgi:hypothetical protein
MDFPSSLHHHYQTLQPEEDDRVRFVENYQPSELRPSEMPSQRGYNDMMT